MTDETTEPAKTDPLVGFDIQDYDKGTETVTIQIHKKILESPRHLEALHERLIETFGESVSRVSVVPRP